MYYYELIQMIKRILSGTIDKTILAEYLIDSLDCEKVYESDDVLLTDVFFSIKHFASGEEEIGKEEWLYFMECLLGEREYNIAEKMRIAAKPSNRQD